MRKIVTELAMPEQGQRLIRLAPYTRVSSGSDDQLHSFAAQVKYYTEYAAAHPEYELVDIYADEAVTGKEHRRYAHGGSPERVHAEF